MAYSITVKHCADGTIIDYFTNNMTLKYIIFNPTHWLFYCDHVTNISKIKADTKSDRTQYNYAVINHPSTFTNNLLHIVVFYVMTPFNLKHTDVSKIRICWEILNQGIVIAVEFRRISGNLTTYAYFKNSFSATLQTLSVLMFNHYKYCSTAAKLSTNNILHTNRCYAYFQARFINSKYLLQILIRFTFVFYV
jgi:hypothetical protein